MASKECQSEEGKFTSETDLKIFCDTLRHIFEQNQRVDRITVPLFKFTERLIISGHLDPILLDEQSKFAFELFSLIKKEVCGGAGAAPCSDPNKIMSAADVLCALLPIAQKFQTFCLVPFMIVIIAKT